MAKLMYVTPQSSSQFSSVSQEMSGDKSLSLEQQVSHQEVICEKSLVSKSNPKELNVAQ